jgi:nicotinamidase/pyrazinamidase
MSAKKDPAQSALLVIDVQNDFCPGGSLAVPDGDKIIPLVNELMPRFPLVVATRDWHPEGHISFASRHPGREPSDSIEVDGRDQILWPDHCVQASEGAAFHPELDQRYINLVLHKGAKRDLDSYSAFFENDHKTSTGLEYYLKGLGFESVYLVGLAEDVCVFFTAVDAKRVGFKTSVVSDATRGVNVPEGNLESARKSMASEGVEYVGSDALL